MAEETVALELPARLIRNLQAGMTDFRDRLTVQTAILPHPETAQNPGAGQLRAPVRQQQRTADRLPALEEEGR